MKIRTHWFDPTALGMRYAVGTVAHWLERDYRYTLEAAARDLRRIADEMDKIRESYKNE